jgi:hypothetical protein
MQRPFADARQTSTRQPMMCGAHRSARHARNSAWGTYLAAKQGMLRTRSLLCVVLLSFIGCGGKDAWPSGEFKGSCNHWDARGRESDDEKYGCTLQVTGTRRAAKMQVRGAFDCDLEGSLNTEKGSEPYTETTSFHVKGGTCNLASFTKTCASQVNTGRIFWTYPTSGGAKDHAKVDTSVFSMTVPDTKTECRERGTFRIAITGTNMPIARR